MTGPNLLSSVQPSTRPAGASTGSEPFLEPISGRLVARNGEQPVAQWLRGLPDTDVALSILHRWPGGAPLDMVVQRVEAELRLDIAGPTAAPPSGSAAVDQFRAESDGIKTGYAIGSLAAVIERRIATHPDVPHDTAARFAAALRDRGAALSFGAAREATADPDTFAFGGRCLPNASALVAAVWREQANPNGPVLRDYTPDMVRRAEVSAMNRAMTEAPRNDALGTGWGETMYWYAQRDGVTPAELNRAYAGGTIGDALIGLGGSFAAVDAARGGLTLPGGQAGPMVREGQVRQVAMDAPRSELQPTMLNGQPGLSTSSGGAIVATERGVALAPELLRLQGTAASVGDFKNIGGSAVQEIIARVPKDWTLASQKLGMGVRFVDETGTERLRLHGPSDKAPPGSNSSAGWTVRVHVPGTKNNYFDNSGDIVGPKQTRDIFRSTAIQWRANKP